MLEKGDLRYNLRPRVVDMGERWFSVEFENIGDSALQNLNIRLHSLDTYGIEVVEGSRYIPQLAPKTPTAVFFRVRTLFTAHLYLTIDGYKDDAPYYWESMPQRINVGDDVASIAYFFAAAKSRLLLNDKIEGEIGIKANGDVSDLRVEFWAEDPEHIVEEIDTVNTGTMSANEMKMFKTTITPSKKGIYTVYAYLFDSVRRLGYEKMYLLVE